MAGAYRAFDAYEAGLTRQLVGGLTALSGERLMGVANPNLVSRRVSTISFVRDRILAHRFAQVLAAEDFNVWSGHNYALEPARHLGLPEDEGASSASASHIATPPMRSNGPWT